MEIQACSRIDTNYIDHAIKFMERRALTDDDPSLKRLSLEIVWVKLTHGFIISGFAQIFPEVMTLITCFACRD